MAKEFNRRGIPFDADDEIVLRQLQDELKPKYGVQNVTAIIRMALRAFLEQQRASQ
jgi:hypothetical protein